ncbi:hypothetical protein FISHEDRAFT_42554 [Fistulina hepatica ATCC 64428]|uniref:P-loop containing nucleoside triphosphate hydrolase protein n=1 Tax=Fistulina hepatica ATCC 64428 TaxID=1128425 RepID=A0A0D7AG34_9AGAR|nr:hypothetical protein FISHEDRAFT_42554 [Fistulina hepatica ATCC 64428]
MTARRVAEEGVGLSNASLSKGRRAMLDLVNRLQNTGFVAFSMLRADLPMIAVIGSQSAGKSSLIEAISGITLPRAAGTCTRCPTECRLAFSKSAWQCKVSLRFATDANGQPLGQVRNIAFGDVITDKRSVEERIRRAQRAILNPDTPHTKFLDGEEDDDLVPQLSFSINCVSLEISGPDVADLSFCDLPGLIASVSSAGRAGDIALVTSLVLSYIKKPNCVILLTVTCETDFENQGAFALAKQYDPSGLRTVGVLTKPDRIPSGEEDSWVSYVKNQKERLENNWYCVKQPSSNDLKAGMTWEGARRAENEFFSSTAPWCELESHYQRYLRTSNLVERLSSILSDLIAKRVPEIQDELNVAVQKTIDDINKLPRAPSKDAQAEITQLLAGFCNDIHELVEGSSSENGVLQAIRPHQDGFRHIIRGTAPEFRPYERAHADDSRYNYTEPPFVAHEDPDFVVRESPTSGILEDGKIYIDEVFEKAQRMRSRELPGNYPFVVQCKYIHDITDKWSLPALCLCHTVHYKLSLHVKDVIIKRFENYGQGLLEQRVKVLMQEHLKHRLEETRTYIEWLFELEQRPFTLNTHYLSDYKSKFLAHYKGIRRSGANASLMNAITNYKKQVGNAGNNRSVETRQTYTIAKILSHLASLGVAGIDAPDLPRVLPPDEMEPAMIIMADVRAYFQVAYKRFADNVPLAIDMELVRSIDRDLLQCLLKGLSVQGPEAQRVCEELSQESPQVSWKREELSKRLERLNTANEELLNLSR